MGAAGRAELLPSPSGWMVGPAVPEGEDDPGALLSRSCLLSLWS